MNGIGSRDATMKVDELISGVCGLGKWSVMTDF